MKYIIQFFSLLGIIIWLTLTVLWMISVLLLIYPIILGFLFGDFWMFLLLFIALPIIGDEKHKELMNKLEPQDDDE